MPANTVYPKKKKTREGVHTHISGNPFVLPKLFDCDAVLGTHLNAATRQSQSIFNKKYSPP
jgi:hypothetical protein